LEAGYVVLAVAVRFALPQLSWLGVILLWVGAILFAVTLIWWITHGQSHR